MDVNVNPTYPLFSVFAFFSFFLILIPLPLHIQAWNVGTCAYIVWVSVACLLEFINSVIWRNNTLNLAPVWCDISSKILLGAGVGIPAAGLCISRRLYVISSIKTAVKTRQDRCRAAVLDSCTAFGIPMLIMALHYVVQGHRFDILEDVGCYPSIYNTLLAYFLVFMWPSLLGCISFVFSAFTLHAFYKRRLEFSQLLSTYSSLSMTRYIRLMMLALSEMLFTVPISIYSIYIANKGVQIQPWISWADTHYNFSYVGQIPAVVWMSDPNYRLSVELTRWLFPASGFVFFFLFGLGSEARKSYRAAFLHVAKLIGYKRASEMPAYMPQKWKSNLNKKNSVGSLPVYVPTTSPHVKYAISPVSSAVRSFDVDVDVEKAAGCSSPSLPSYSSQYQQPSPTATCSGGDIEESEDTMTNSGPVSVHCADRCTVPAYHRPFSLPSVCPVPLRALQEPRPLGGVCITMQTQYAPTV
ncbi:putative fungal pheromone GPCR, STE3-type [Boletus coccyginus]|nr:putative fungal pheromone GPCR, STE3-type [Boletus coccyginus]